MRHRFRTAAVTATTAALLASAACWSDIKEDPTYDSVGAYEAAAGADTATPMGGPLPVPVDTTGPAGRDSAGQVVDPPATPAAPATSTPRTPPPTR